MQTGAVYPRQTNTCLLIFYFLPAEKAKRKRPPLFQLRIQGWMLLVRCWKCSLQHSAYSGDANGSGLPTANKYLFADLYFLRVESATRQRRSLLQLKIRGLMLPARCWKCSLQQNKCSGNANKSGLPMANKYLFVNIYFLRAERATRQRPPLLQHAK